MEHPKPAERFMGLPGAANRKRALITGVAGQIGSYLAELLIEKGYEVYGIIRRTSQVSSARERIDHINDLNLLYGDLGDSAVIEKIMREVQPDEVYSLGAQSHVWISFHIPEYTSDVNALGTLRICEAAKALKRPVKIYQASTSELYGGMYDYPVNEDTPFYPRSPYGVSKLYAFWTMKNYREAYNMFCSNGIVFNSESPRRSENFVTRKITKGIIDIMEGKKDKLHLGNLNAKRDWNHAKDAALAMWLMLQADKPGDYIMASGKSHSVREFVEEAFKHVGIEIDWKGEGLNEVGYDKRTGREYVMVDPYYFRPSEVDVLIGDSTKLRTELGWKPSYTFQDIVKDMMEHELSTMKKKDIGANGKDVMKISPADMIDRLTIIKLKKERIGDPALTSELYAYERAVQELNNNGTKIKQEWIDELYSINGREWDLLEEMYDERKNGGNYEKIGKIYIETEKVNKNRAELKNKIVEETGLGFKEIKKNHPSA